MLALGEFGTDNFSADGSKNSQIVWLLFVAATFLSQITILNMLIAIMGDTFGRVYEQQDQAALKEQFIILKDFVKLLHSSEVEDKFMFVAQPTNLIAENDESWDGNISAIRNSMQEILDVSQATVNKKIS